MTVQSGYPILLRGARIRALVVGGGAVAGRKVGALVDGGIPVRVVALELSPELAERELAGEIVVERRTFTEDDVAGVELVIAATDSADLNAAIARAARAAGALVNIVDDGDGSDFVTPAVHRNGPLVVAVSTGGVPQAATRVRNMLAERLGPSYGEALDSLGLLRRSLLEAGQRDRWREASASLLGPGFSESVENGTVLREVESWR